MGFMFLSLRHKDGKEKDAKRACKGWESCAGPQKDSRLARDRVVRNCLSLACSGSTLLHGVLYSTASAGQSFQ